MVLRSHLFSKDVHEASEIYPSYPPKIKNNLIHNAVRLSIYGKTKWAAILKLSYSPKTSEVTYTFLKVTLFSPFTTKYINE